MTVIEAEAESLAKSVPLLAADLQEGRALFGQMLSHLYLALADEDRLDRERQERYIKRSATFNAVKFY